MGILIAFFLGVLVGAAALALLSANSTDAQRAWQDGFLAGHKLAMRGFVPPIPPPQGKGGRNE